MSDDKEIEQWLISRLALLKESVVECEQLAKMVYGQKAYLFLEGSNCELYVCYEQGGDPRDEIVLDAKIALPVDFGWFK